MVTRIGEILHDSDTDGFSGRIHELAALIRLVTDDQPLIFHLHGIPGIGKSALLCQFIRQARAANTDAFLLDCHLIEPTERGFWHALSCVFGQSITNIAEAAILLGDRARRVLLVLDGFEACRLIDVWLCRDFISALPDNVRIVLSSRLPPAAHWENDPRWQNLVGSLYLDTLEDAEAIELLVRTGLCISDAQRLLPVGRGHPLALRLAARARLERPRIDLGGFDESGVMSQLVELTLADITDAPLRQAIEAASVLRRITEPLLAAIFPCQDARQLYSRLRETPVIEQRRDGLALHEAVRRLVAASLKAANPERFQLYRSAAWRYLRTRIQTEPTVELWRNTADVIFLLGDPAVRDAFFPNSQQTLTVSRAQAEEGDEILRLVAMHDGEEATALLAAWWSRQRDAFHTVRDSNHGLVGFYCLAEAETLDPVLLATDPVAAQWRRQMQKDPTPRGQKALFLRRWLATIEGEGPCPVQAACWLDIKRTYLELRPKLRRVYLTLRGMARYESVATKLGFRPLDQIVSLDGAVYKSALLDFGPSSVDGWLAGVLEAELGAEPGPLDAGAREFVIDCKRIALTGKEFAFIEYLSSNANRAVSRDELLNDVWGWEFEGGSNVVDAIVAAIRRKLGPQGTIIQTVRGVGYRYRGPET